MADLTSINLTISQILTQAQETILVLYKKLQAIRVQTKAKKPETEIPATKNNTKEAQLK